MEKLTLEDELEIMEFGQELESVSGPEDLFPPDGGVREPQPKPRPVLPPIEAVVELQLIGMAC